MRRSPRRIWGTIASLAFSQLVIVLILRLPEVTSGTWLDSFRGYFSFDQLSYGAIATTVAGGGSAAVEPFTETGVSYYPSLWYQILGSMSSVSGLSVPATWTLAGFVTFAACVFVLGLVALRITGRAWAPALVGPSLMFGTLSVALTDNWYTPLESHAVLWGPFGALYPLNGEVAAFACAATGLGLALALLLRPPLSRAWSTVGFVVAALLIGVTANMQTYAFFVAVTVVFAWTGFTGLVRSRSNRLIVITAVAVVVLVLIGPAVAGAVGALPVFVLLLATTLPGSVWLLRRYWRSMLAPLVVLVLSAAPQVVHVAMGVLAGDEFLTYRQGASSDLGVSLIEGVFATLPIAAVWWFAVRSNRAAPNTVVSGLLGGLAFTLVMLTANNRWGFSQEPYRLWIDSVVIAALLLGPVLARGLTSVAPLTRAQWPRWTTTSAVVAGVLVALSLLDVGAYRVYVREAGVIDFSTDRFARLAALTDPVDGLLMSDPCIDLQQLKIVTGKPVAFYNLGIAWPENRAGIDQALSSYRAGTYDREALRAAGVRYLVTDTGCGNPWPVAGSMGALELDSVEYADADRSGTLTLWRLG